jgi:hypothetical protein
MMTLKSKPLKIFRGICWLGVGIWVTTVFILSSMSGPEIGAFDIAKEVNDKILHFIAFFCGTLPLVPGLRLSYGWTWKKVFWVTVGLISLYGALDEVHQLWTPSRSGGDPGDWLADTIGALAGTAFAVKIHAYCERKLSPAPAGN